MWSPALALEIACAFLAYTADGRPGSVNIDTFHPHPHEPRALPANAPHGYTPQTNNCPSNPPQARDARSGLATEETAWLQKRRPATLEPMRQLLNRINIKGLNTNNYINQHRNNVSALPNIGIAVSGGGYRAMLNGAGVIEAFDSRTTNATNTGQLGGLLQSATYVSALSGGSWLVGSLYTNNFSSVDHILAHDTPADGSGSLWQFGNSIFEGPDSGGIQLFDSAGYYDNLLDDVKSKKDAGFNTSITDYWGRALSYQLVEAKDGGPEFTWSSLADQQFFTSGSVPCPLIVADSRAPGETIVGGNASVYTFSPWEMGSEDPNVSAFAPLQYIGTDYTSGSPTSDNACVTGFDNVGFVMGTSSSLFNSALTTVNSAKTTGLFSSALQSAISAVLSSIGQDNNDISVWPNPFYHFSPNNANQNADSHTLSLVDGGEDGQNIPLHPLIQPSRAVDVIFAVDSSADTNASNPTQGSAANWPDGAALVATYTRSLTALQNGTAFPSIPSTTTFFNLGLNNRPTFFGCDVSNLTGPSPLIVYLPNAPYTYNSNVSTFDLSYSDSERNALVLNGYNLATQANGTLDSEWSSCVGCAILSRSLHRTGTEVPEVCTRCFSRYCWDGTVDDSKPKAYVPSAKVGIEEVTSGAGRMGRSNGVLVAGVGLAAAVAWAW